MNRVEENLKFIDAISEISNRTPSGTVGEITCLHLAAIASLLTDISRSLAVIADNVKEEKA